MKKLYNTKSKVCSFVTYQYFISFISLSTNYNIIIAKLLNLLQYLYI